MSVEIKRIYAKPARTDGTRVLVDRLWPRGLSKDDAALNAWLRELAPSNELRQWFHASPDAWTTFRRKYLKELARPEAAADLSQLYQFAARGKKLTLLFASQNEERNNAVVLRDLLDGMRKPPTGAGAGAAAGRARHVRRMPQR